MTERAGKQRRLEDAQARKTALVVAFVLLLIAAWNFYRGRTTVFAVTGGAALALVVVGLFVPAAARRFHVLWMRIAVALGWVNSRILLSLMFYGVFTPYRIVSRLVGRDPLHRRGKRKESYWTERKTTRQAREQFERLF
ncbi:MAG TPA: SxtJ family membrane protein [Pyrinomonadaceae bacterium]|nr:SxtJ family membrane protein [Pyrinomonadaceae bacterium]